MADAATVIANRRRITAAAKALLALTGALALLLVAIITALLGGIADQQQRCDGAGPSGAVPGGFVGPGSLGGAAGTGITPVELQTVRGRLGPRRLTPGSYRSTAYGPPWGVDPASGVDQGAGQATAGGIRLNGGNPRLYMIAVDPALISLGELVYAWPNPFGWKGPFLAADTGGAINGRHIDFYDWRGRNTQLAWSRPTQVSRKPIKAGGPDLTAGPDTATGLLPVSAGAGAPAADCDPAGTVAPSGPAGTRIAALARRYLGKGPSIPGFAPPSVSYAWCAWFVTNVWRKAGVPIPISAASNYPYQWAAAKGLLFKAAGQPPKGTTPPLGSAVMYGSGPASTATSDHVNLVSRVLPDGSFELIGGNQTCPGSANCVSRRGPCRLTGGANTHLSGPACGDTRPVYGIAVPARPHTAR